MKWIWRSGNISFSYKRFKNEQFFIREEHNFVNLRSERFLEENGFSFLDHKNSNFFLLFLASIQQIYSSPNLYFPSLELYSNVSYNRVSTATPTYLNSLKLQPLENNRHFGTLFYTKLLLNMQIYSLLRQALIIIMPNFFTKSKQKSRLLILDANNSLTSRSHYHNQNHGAFIRDCMIVIINNYRFKNCKFYRCTR